MVRYKMLGRDVDSSPIQYRTWVVNDTPDLTGALYTGDKSGPSPLVNITAYAILDPNEVVGFNLPNPLDWATTRRVLPELVCDSQIAIIDGYIYLFGGQNSADILQASVNRPADWVDTGADLPGPLAGSQLAIVDGYIYLFGGATDATMNSGTKAIYSAPVSNPLNWTNDGYLLPDKLHHSQLAIADGYLYLFGGYGPDGATSVIYQASTSDPLLWTSDGYDLPNPLYGSQVAILDGYVCLFGGLTSGNVPTSNIYAAPLTNPTSWSIMGQLPFPAFYGQFATVGSQGFLFTPTDSTTSFTRILRCDTDEPFLWVDTQSTVPGSVAQSQLAIVYDRLFLYGGNGNTVIYANNSLLKYKLDSITTVSYGFVTRTQYNATPNLLDLFAVLGFPNWKADYGVVSNGPPVPPVIPVTPFIPPTPPSLPSGSVLDLFINAGRTVSGGNLTNWNDLTHSINFTVPGGQSAPTVSSTIVQQYDGNLWSSSSSELSNTTTTLFTAGESCTVLIVAKNTDAGGNISTALRVGSSGKTREFLAGGGFIYGDGTTNVSVPNLYLGGPWVMSWSVTPGSGTPAARLNGWNVIYPNTTASPSGSPGIDSGSSGIQVGTNDAFTAGYFHGYEEELHAYGRILSATDQGAAEGNLAMKFGLVGVSGYISDSAAITFYGLGDQHMLFRASLAATRFYTTATSITLGTQQNTSAGPSITNLPDLTILVDGHLNSTYVVPTSSSPFAPNTSVLSLDGNPHVVEIWDGPATQSSAATPNGATLTFIQDSTAKTLILPATIPVNRLVVYGDSISLGCGASVPANGAFQMLRYSGHVWNGRVSHFGTIGRSLNTDKSVDVTFASTANALVSLAQEVQAGGVKLIWIEISLNDYLGSTFSSAATWGTAMGTLVDAIHSADSTIKIILQGAISAIGESTPNANGYTLANLRSQMSSIAAARPSFCNYVDASNSINGAPPVTTSQLADNYHPTNAGHVTYNAWIVAALELLGYPVM